MKALFVVALLLAARPVLADDTFEAKAQTAIPLHRVESLVWALTSSCDAGDDVEQRQCRRVRDARGKELAAGTWLVVADADAFDVGAWNPTKKFLPVSLDACIRCAGVEVDGKTWMVTGGTGKRGTKLHDSGRAFADEATATLWSHAVAKVKVEMVVKAARRIAGENRISVDVVAYRVFTPCDGTVILSSPPSSPVEPDKKQCAPAKEQVSVAEAEAGPQIEQLTASVIDEAMQPVVDAAWKCYGHYAVTGKAKLKLQVTGEGGIGKYEQQGDFTNTPMGTCIDNAVAKVHFPRSKKSKSTVLFPITIQP
jgi:hypothetical protein